MVCHCRHRYDCVRASGSASNDGDGDLRHLPGQVTLNVYISSRLTGGLISHVFRRNGWTVDFAAVAHGACFLEHRAKLLGVRARRNNRTKDSCWRGPRAPHAPFCFRRTIQEAQTFIGTTGSMSLVFAVDANSNNINNPHSFSGIQCCVNFPRTDGRYLPLVLVPYERTGAASKRHL